MAYQAKRNQHYIEQLELVDEAGNVVYTLDVDLDPDEVAENLSKKYIELLQIRREIQGIDTIAPESLPEAYTKVGNAVIAMIQAVFGAENTKIIYEFYGSRYNQILTEVMPFITDIVVPKVRELAQENRKNALAKYSRKRKRFTKKKVG